MKNIFKIVSVFVFCIVMASCSKSKSDDIAPLRDYATQYVADLGLINQYIDSHYLTFDADYNVTFDTLLPSSGHLSIRTDPAFLLKDTTVVQNSINYKVYFIKFREGNQRRPTQVDSVNVSFKGINLVKSAQFDAAVSPVWFKLQEVISGWSHIIPSFKTGTYTSGSGGNPTTYNDFGAGVMFLPSALAYYNNSVATIPAYSPIIFSFKLIELRYRDQDYDGILSKDERVLDPSINPLIRWKENPAASVDYHYDDLQAGVYDVSVMDTDQDGVANMYDIDDDGDHVLTRVEIKNPLGGLYLYNLIPDCSGDTTTQTRKRKHLDPNCQ